MYLFEVTDRESRQNAGRINIQEPGPIWWWELVGQHKTLNPQDYPLTIEQGPQGACPVLLSTERMRLAQSTQGENPVRGLHRNTRGRLVQATSQSSQDPWVG